MPEFTYSCKTCEHVWTESRTKAEKDALTEVLCPDCNVVGEIEFSLQNTEDNPQQDCATATQKLEATKTDNVDLDAPAGVMPRQDKLDEEELKKIEKKKAEEFDTWVSEWLENKPKLDGRYQVKDYMTRGGQCAIYRAEHEFGGGTKQVTIKRYWLGGGNQKFRTELKTKIHKIKRGETEEETKILLTLSKSNHFVRVLDYGVFVADKRKHLGDFWMAMEYVEPWDDEYEARTLGKHLKKLTNIKEKVKIIREVCKGIAYAHEHGRLHGDIKPNNILVNREGKPLIIDFGISGLTGAFTEKMCSPRQAAGFEPTEGCDTYMIGKNLLEEYCLYFKENGAVNDDMLQFIERITVDLVKVRDGVPACPECGHLLESITDIKYPGLANFSEVAGTHLGPANTLDLLLKIWEVVHTERGAHNVIEERRVFETLQGSPLDQYNNNENPELTLARKALAYYWQLQVNGTELHANTHKALILFVRDRLYCEKHCLHLVTKETEDFRNFTTRVIHVACKMYNEVLGHNDIRLIELCSMGLELFSNRGVADEENYERSKRYFQYARDQHERIVLAQRDLALQEAKFAKMLDKNRSEQVEILERGYGLSVFACEFFRKSLTIDPKDSELCQLLSTLYSEEGQTDKAEKLLSDHYDLRSNSVPRPEDDGICLDTALQLAKLYIKTGAFEKAIPKLHVVLSHDSDRYGIKERNTEEIAKLLITCYEKMGNKDVATKLKEAYQIGDD